MVLNRITGRSQSNTETTTQAYAARHIDRRYLGEFVQFCQQNHLFGSKIPLTEIAVEPRFIPPVPLVTAQEEEVDPDVFRVVPQNHRHPFMHAPYNLPTLGIADLSRGTQRIALLGPNGSGRTTALMCIALWSLQLLDFAPPYDKIQEDIDRYEEKLTPEERAKRIKYRIRVAQQAQERMSETDGRTYIGTDDENEVEVVEPFRKRMPIYCHLASLDFSASRRNTSVDPAERLIEALQEQYSFITAKTLPRSLYQAISDGRVVFLFDGYETLTQEEQGAAQDWLDALLAAYPNNYTIITGLPTGYHWLEKLDITPVFLRPWNETTIIDAIDKQLEANTAQLDEATHANLITESRFLFPVDIALMTNFALSNTDQGPSQAGQWVQHFLAQHMNDLDTWIPFLQQLAEQELDTGTISLGAVVDKERIKQTWTPFDVIEEDATLNNNGTSVDTEVKTRDRTPLRRVQRILKYLQSEGILRQLAPGRYIFHHQVIASYVAGQGLHYADEAEMAEKAILPQWARAIGYAAETVPIDVAVQAHLKQPADVLLAHIIDVSQWLTYAGKKSTWRQHLLRLLGNLFVAPNQFIRVREQIAATLVSSRDDGARMILRAALQNPNPDIRILSSLGLGALRDTGAIQPLTKLSKNPDEMVQIAATLALGAIGTEEALVSVLRAMQGSESRGVRKAAAEMLAMYPDVGYETLYDAINEETDILLRRAILFGLGRIRTNWALITINEVVSSGKEEYYVRLAAMEVFRMIYEKESQGVIGYPSANAVPWLIAWGQQQQRAGAISDEATGEEMLVFALESRQPQIRYLALLTMAQLGLVGQISHIYKRLYDPNEAIRDTAYRTLVQFQERLGTALPLPI